MTMTIMTRMASRTLPRFAVRDRGGDVRADPGQRVLVVEHA